MNWLERRRSRRNPTGQPRGRPPHPDVLTPAEWRVLEHVRRGESNPEIAARLDVSVNTVRAQVSSMLAKLNVHDRHELATWPGEQPAPTRSSSLLAPFGWLGTRLEVVVLTAVAAVLVGGIVFALQSGVLSEESPSGVAGVPTPRPEGTSEASDDGREQALFPRLQVGPPVDFPADIALYVWEGCTSCDGPATALRRFEVIDGAIQEHRLFERGVNPPYIVSGWVEGDAIYIAECSTGYCGGGSGDRTADAAITLHRSHDRGATWESLGGGPAPEDVILQPVDPAAWGIASTPPVPVRTAEDGVWQVGSVELDLRALDPRGAAQPDPPAYFLVGRVEVNERGWLAARWIARVSPEQVFGYLTIFDRDGAPIWTYESSGQVVWLDANRLIGTVIYSIDGRYQSPDIEAGWIPSIIDLRDGSLHPILDPFATDASNRNTVMGVQR